MDEPRGKCLALLRIRGNVGIAKELQHAFKFMHLNRKNHLTLMEETASNLGAIKKVKDYSTWGEITLETISLLLQKRSFLEGRKKLTDDYVKNELSYVSIEDLAKAIYDSRINFWKLPHIKPIFRLHPPRKGFRGSVRKPYPEGELGYRGEKINALIAKMI